MQAPQTVSDARDAGAAVKPFRAGRRRSGVVLFTFALAAAWVVWRHRGELALASGWLLAAIPLAMVAACFAHAYAAAAAFLGARRADLVFRSLLVVVLVGGVWWLTRYPRSDEGH